MKKPDTSAVKHSVSQQRLKTHCCPDGSAEGGQIAIKPYKTVTSIK